MAKTAIFGLIVRDLMIQRKRLWLVPAYCVVGPLLLGFIGRGAMAIVMAGMVYLIVINAFEFDDKHHADTIMVSLPVTREALVTARYLQIPIFAALSVLLYILTTVLLSPWLEGMFPIRWVLPAGIFLGISIVFGLYMPFVYRFGYSKTRVYNLLFMLVFCSLPLVLYLWETWISPRIMGSLMGPDGIAAVSMVLAGVAVLWFSSRISMRMYRKRQF
jgi:ABC-2 type transport system permease protein